MADNKTSHTDEGLQDNEQIEQAILALQQQPSQSWKVGGVTRRLARALRSPGVITTSGLLQRVPLSSSVACTKMPGRA